MRPRFVPSDIVKSEIKTKEKTEVVMENGVVKTVKKTYKVLKRWFKGIDITNYKICSHCGGYNKPTRTKFKNYWTTHCYGCGSELK